MKKAARPQEDGIVPFKEGEVLCQEAQGDPQPERKMAEQQASKIMLELIAPDQYEIAIQEKEKEIAAVTAAVIEGKQDPLVGDPKSHLNKLLMKVAKRSLTKADVIYRAGPVEGGIQAQCEIVFRGETYVGEVCNTKKEAESSVAEIILQALQEEGHIWIEPASLERAL